MLILASASPRRLELLKQIGLVPDLVVAPAIEETARRGELPRDLALRLAAEKLDAACALPQVRAVGEGAVILAADTVVACGRRSLPKAETAADARRCLALLSGRRHRVYTAISVRAGETLRSRIVETHVGVKRLTDGQIETYLASGEWQGKAGGYAIQGRAAAFITGLNGSYTNVVGLPLYETAGLLGAAGIL